MLRRDDHHLGRERSAQLTQSVWLFVIYRKLTQGSRTEDGALTAERLLSAAISWRLQGRSPFSYLVEVAQASIRGQPSPALV